MRFVKHPSFQHGGLLEVQMYQCTVVHLRHGCHWNTCIAHTLVYHDLAVDARFHVGGIASHISVYVYTGLCVYFQKLHTTESVYHICLSVTALP